MHPEKREVLHLMECIALDLGFSCSGSELALRLLGRRKPRLGFTPARRILLKKPYTYGTPAEVERLVAKTKPKRLVAALHLEALEEDMILFDGECSPTHEQLA